MGTTVADKDIELKTKISRIEHLENEKLCLLKVYEHRYNK